MNSYSLGAVSPIDGRYAGQTEHLAGYFSEFAIIGARLSVEVYYFFKLCQLPLPQLKRVTAADIKKISKILYAFDSTAAERVKEIELTTNHDVKAVEYYLKEKFEKIGLSKYSEFIHFGLTSQDINNTVFPLMLKRSYEEMLLPMYKLLVSELDGLLKKWSA